MLSGNGDGTFGPAALYSVDGGSDAIVTAEFNGDAKLDLAAVSYAQSSLSVLISSGTNFAAKTVYPLITNSHPGQVIAADFNGDSKPDLVTANFLTNNVSVLLNNNATSSAGISVTNTNVPKATRGQ